MNPLLSFLQEIFTRLKAKSPKFFVVWQWIFGVVTAITGIPGFLAMFHVNIPHLFATYVDQMVSIATSALWFMSKMPVAPPVVAVTSDSHVITRTDNAKLPFTSEVEKKAAYANGQLSSSSLTQVVNDVSK